VQYVVYCANDLRHKHAIQVLRDFHSFKIGPDVVLAARGSFGVNLKELFDSPTSVCYSCYIDIFHLSLTFHKLFAIFTVLKSDRK
jgi:hypothetical protein